MQKQVKRFLSALSLTTMGAFAFQSQGFAGVFNLPHFVMPGDFAIGLEPEFIMTGGAALGVNLKYTHGLSELSNLTGIIGTGGGGRQFRVGGNFTLDIFPDTGPDAGDQPGIGVAFQGLFWQYQSPIQSTPGLVVSTQGASALEVTAIPYLHKSLSVEQGDFEPFVALPIGVALSQGSYQTLASAVIGSLFKHNDHFRTVLEFGVSISNSPTYVSGGFVYYH
jgi:hypothetical protein